MFPLSFLRIYIFKIKKVSIKNKQKCKINKSLTLKKLLKNLKCKINKNLTLKKSLKLSLTKSKKFNFLLIYNINNGKYKAWRFIPI